jgi:hypothetical protein
MRQHMSHRMHTFRKIMSVLYQWFVFSVPLSPDTKEKKKHGLRTIFLHLVDQLGVPPLDYLFDRDFKERK